MLTKSAEKHFGSRSDIARVLKGRRTVSAVYQWGDVVPLMAARTLAELSEGKVPVDESLYDQYGRIESKSNPTAA